MILFNILKNSLLSRESYKSINTNLLLIKKIGKFAIMLLKRMMVKETLIITLLLVNNPTNKGSKLSSIKLQVRVLANASQILDMPGEY